ncbi:MAG: type IV toxin-antitoxin system AbiEi family antitoxin domain-containing protein [Saccharofermentanales bacterium]|jgi:hypothetical protein
MIKTTAMLLKELQDFRAPANKLALMVKQGKIFPIVRGLYETDNATPGYLLAASIYGPSYLSFEFALAYWHLIPEAVFVFTSATFAKKKRKRFETGFGVFTYRDVPKNVYPLGIRIINEGDYSYFIAEPEKALCDKLYIMPPVSSIKNLEALLFSDLRIDRQQYALLNKENLLHYAGLYRTTNHKLLKKFVRREK